MPKCIFHKNDYTSASIGELGLSANKIYAVIVGNGASALQAPCGISLLYNAWGVWTLTSISNNFVSLNENTFKFAADYGRNVVAIYEL